MERILELFNVTGIPSSRVIGLTPESLIRNSIDMEGMREPGATDCDCVCDCDCNCDCDPGD